MKIQETFWDRLSQRCMEKWPTKFPSPESVTQQKAAQLIGLSQNAGWKWKHGMMPEPKHLVRLAQKLDVARAWLESGDGPKFNPAPEDVVVAEILVIATRLSVPQRMELLRYAQYIEGDRRQTGSR